MNVLIYPVVLNSVKSLSNTGTYIANSNVGSITYGLPQTELPGFEHVNMHDHACQLASLRDSQVRGNKALF